MTITAFICLPFARSFASPVSTNQETISSGYSRTLALRKSLLRLAAKILRRKERRGRHGVSPRCVWVRTRWSYPLITVVIGML